MGVGYIIPQTERKILYSFRRHWSNRQQSNRDCTCPEYTFTPDAVHVISISESIASLKKFT